VLNSAGKNSSKTKRASMKAKKKSLVLLCALFLFTVASIFALSYVDGISISAVAETIPKYNLAFSYEHIYTYNSNGISTPTKKKGTDVYSATVANGANSYTTCSVAVYWDVMSGTGNLPYGGAINSSAVNIEVTTDFADGGSITVTSFSKRIKI